jgi:hypothetical protein
MHAAWLRLSAQFLFEVFYRAAGVRRHVCGMRFVVSTHPKHTSTARGSFSAPRRAVLAKRDLHRPRAIRIRVHVGVRRLDEGNTAAIFIGAPDACFRMSRDFLRALIARMLPQQRFTRAAAAFFLNE